MQLRLTINGLGSQEKALRIQRELYNLLNEKVESGDFDYFVFEVYQNSGSVMEYDNHNIANDTLTTVRPDPDS